MIAATFSIAINVNDAKRLRRAALERCLDDMADGNFYPLNLMTLRTYCRTLSDCLVMLFDPGVSPDGCEIMDSSVDWFDTETRV